MGPQKSWELQQLENRINRDLRMRKRVGCKNINLSVELDKDAPGGYVITPSGCQNERRTGSAYCEDCSIKYKELQNGK